MMLNVIDSISFFGYIIGLAYIALLIVGVVQCKKHSFKPGFYFFLIIIIGHMYSWVSSIFIRGYLERNMGPNGMSVGEWYIVLTYIPRVIEVIAFGFLVIGLYRMWNRRLVTTTVKDIE